MENYPVRYKVVGVNFTEERASSSRYIPVRGNISAETLGGAVAAASQKRDRKTIIGCGEREYQGAITEFRVYDLITNGEIEIPIEVLERSHDGGTQRRQNRKGREVEIDLRNLYEDIFTPSRRA